MLRNGYWLFEFISISQIILKAPVKYYRAFLFTETDGNDLTYFLIHQAKAIALALEELKNYIAQKTQGFEEVADLLNRFEGLNYRQQALLTHALKHPNYQYTISEHQVRHGIVNQTARTDLLNLAELGLLDKVKRGKVFIFVAPQNLQERLLSLTDETTNK